MWNFSFQGGDPIEHTRWIEEHLVELYQKASTGRDKYGGYIVRKAWPRASGQ